MAFGSILIFTLSACGFLNEDTGQSNSTTKIIVWCDDVLTEFTIKYDEQANITPFFKQNYYLRGYYDCRIDGTQYFDSSGKSLSVWKENNPHFFYAQWGDLSELQFDNSSEETFKTTYSKTMALYFDVDGDFYNGIRGNLSKKLNFYVSFEMKVGEYTSKVMLLLQNIKGDDGKKYHEEELLHLSPIDYVSYDLNFEVLAEVAIGGRFWLIFLQDSVSELYLKNVNINITF